ncbi:MAG TPA: hypothetical protein VEZ40_18035 [Pyrinomonadaceae bacterium]|nr:hypothetical protein [Pyrinomonadaceae bacterium]
MSDNDATQIQQEDDAAFNRRFKYAVIAYAVIEFIAFVSLFYYKYFRRDA